MSGRLAEGSWAVQQLAGFLTSVTAYPDTRSMVVGAAHRLAEAVDAEVCAIVAGEHVDAVVGFPAADVPHEAILRVAAGEADELDVPGVGRVTATCLATRMESARAVVVARSDEPLDAGERHLLRALAQMLELTLQLRTAADRERRLREAIEDQAGELQRVNEQLEQAMQVKRDLVSTTSHELRTPLVAMLGFSNLLREGWEDFGGDERDEYLGIMVRHGRRMLRLVDDLLTVGRLEDGRLATEPRDVSLSAAVVEVLRDLHADDVAVEVAPDDGVRVDVDHLSQMVANLVDNARKYGAPPISVRVTPAPDTCAVEVVDHGRGVPDGFVPELFDRFTQATTGLHRESTGVGLGLAIVAGLAHGNGGEVTYDRDGGRTRFTLRLPRAPRVDSSP